MEQFSLACFYDFKNFFYLPIRQVALPGQLYTRFQPDLAEFFRSTFTHMNMSSALIEICIIEQKVPYDFGRDV